MLMLLLLLSAAAGVPEPLSVDAIIERHITARGGRERMAALMSLVIRGEYREGDHVSPNATMALMRPYYKLVGDPDRPIGDFAEGYDGSAWEYYGNPGVVLRTVGPASAAGRHAARFDPPLIAVREQGATVAVEGRDTIGDRPAYRILLTLQDGFREEVFIDCESFLIVAERKAAPIHAFGEKVTSETRYSDYRPVEGVLFAFMSREVEIATGRVLSTFTTKSITANHRYDAAVFSPPEFKRTPLQRWIELTYAERDDKDAVMWSYRDFRSGHPNVDTHEAAEVAGYQMLKMGQTASAIAFLEANALDYPQAASSAFGLGRAYRAAGDLAKARTQFERALKLDPGYKRATEALKTIP